MKVKVELLPGKSEVTIELPPGATGLDLVRQVGLAPDIHILVRDDVPIPIDEQLSDRDCIRIIAVVSGG